MKKRLLATLSILLLAGCGAAPTLSPTLQKNTGLSSKAVSASYNTGLNAGLRKAATIYQKGSTTREASLPSNAELAYQYGYVCGLLQGSINSFDRIEGKFGTAEWKSFSYMNADAMKDALDVLKKNPELSTKYAEATGILSGGLASFNAIEGSFDFRQWKSFAYSNLTVLKNALASLQKNP